MVSRAARLHTLHGVSRSTVQRLFVNIARVYNSRNEIRVKPSHAAGRTPTLPLPLRDALLRPEASPPSVSPVAGQDDVRRWLLRPRRPQGLRIRPGKHHIPQLTRAPLISSRASPPRVSGRRRRGQIRRPSSSPTPTSRPSRLPTPRARSPAPTARPPTPTVRSDLILFSSLL